jgi:hypothetical protein
VFRHRALGQPTERACERPERRRIPARRDFLARFRFHRPRVKYRL